MSDHRHHPQFPKTLATFKGLPGEYGNVEVRAQSAHSMRLQLTSEYVDMNRSDGQEMIRAFSAWLAAPVSRIVVEDEAGSAGAPQPIAVTTRVAPKQILRMLIDVLLVSTRRAQSKDSYCRCDAKPRWPGNPLKTRDS